MQKSRNTKLIVLEGVALLESTSGTVLDISGSYLPVMVMVAVLAILAALLALIFGKLFRTEKHC